MPGAGPGKGTGMFIRKKQHLKTVLLTVVLVFTVFPESAYAAAWGSGEIGSIFDILKDMTNIYIRIAYGMMVLVFVFGTVKSGLGAQAAKTFGLPKKVSAEIANFLLGAAVFVFGILSYPIAERIINLLTGSAGTQGVTGLHLDL